MKKKKILYLSPMLLYSQVLAPKHLGRWLTKRKSDALKHLEVREDLINKVFHNCVILIYLMKIPKMSLFRKRIFSMLEFPLKNKWTIFLDKLNSLENQNSLTMYLFKTLLQELILKEKDFKPFWTPAYKALSETLWLPTETDCVVSDLNSLKSSYKKQEVLSKFLTVQETNLQAMNFQKTSCPLSTSIIAEKWEKEVIPVELTEKKTIKIKLYPTLQQKTLLKNIIDTHRFVYNRSLGYIKEEGFSPNFQTLRNLLATERTKTESSEHRYYTGYINKLKEQLQDISIIDEKEKLKEIIKFEEDNLKQIKKELPFKKNPLIYDFELETSNEIRSNAIKSVCDAYKSVYSNFSAGNIKYININYKKKTEKSCVELASSEVSIKNNKVNICPGKLKINSLFKISKRNIRKYKNVQINSNSDLVLNKGNYFLHMTVSTEVTENKKLDTVSGGDLGIRTFLTLYNGKKVYEYKHNPETLKKLNTKLKMLKTLRQKPLKKNTRSKVRKRHLNKIEKKKVDLVESLHWNIISHILKENQVIFLGDIKSHNIVKGNKNKTLNRDFNDLKFYQFKQRLLYKASLQKKSVYLVNESYTTQSCSHCGHLWKTIGDSKVFNCSKCHSIFGRDINASKNMILKGIMKYL
jgi:putative transposase